MSYCHTILVPKPLPENVHVLLSSSRARYQPNGSRSWCPLYIQQSDLSKSSTDPMIHYLALITSFSFFASVWKIMNEFISSEF